MSIYRFISTKPEGAESDEYFVTAVEARDRGAAQKLMHNRLSEDEVVISIQMLLGNKWEVLEGQGGIEASQMSLHPRSTKDLPWEGDSEAASEPEQRVRQPQKYNAGGGAPKVSMGSGTSHLSEGGPLIVNVLYFVTAIFLIGGILTLMSLPVGRMNFIAAVTTIVTALMPALVGWVVTIAISYLDRIHKTLQAIETQQRDAGR